MNKCFKIIAICTVFVGMIISGVLFSNCNRYKGTKDVDSVHVDSIIIDSIFSDSTTIFVPTNN